MLFPEAALIQRRDDAGLGAASMASNKHSAVLRLLDAHAGLAIVMGRASGNAVAAQPAAFEHADQLLGVHRHHRALTRRSARCRGAGPTAASSGLNSYSCNSLSLA